jgi:hypothetical protein
MSPATISWAAALPLVGSGSYTDSNGVTWRVRQGTDSTGLIPYIFAHRLDLADFEGQFLWHDYFSFLINAGAVSGNEWVNGAAFGVEPVSGSGSITIDKFIPTYTGAARVPWTLSSLIATAQSQTEVLLQWKQAGGATSHQYRMNGGTWMATSSSTSHLVTGLTASTAYTFEVRGVNSTGNGAASNVANVTTMAQPHVLPATNLSRRWRADSIAQANNSAIATWPALVGGVDLVQTTPASQPTYVTNRKNGKPAAAWPTGGGSTYMVNATSFAVQSQPVTLSVVCKPYDIASSIELVGWNSIELFIQSSKWSSWSNATIVGSTAVAGAWVVLTAVFNGATSSIYINGTQVGTGNGSSGQLGAILNLGRHQTNFQNWHGDIGELLVYNAAADATTRAQIHSYVQDYWGITVSDYTP